MHPRRAFAGWREQHISVIFYLVCSMIDVWFWQGRSIHTEHWSLVRWRFLGSGIWEPFVGALVVFTAMVARAPAKAEQGAKGGDITLVEVEVLVEEEPQESKRRPSSVYDLPMWMTKEEEVRARKDLKKETAERAKEKARRLKEEREKAQQLKARLRRHESILIFREKFKVVCQWEFDRLQSKPGRYVAPRNLPWDHDSVSPFNSLLQNFNILAAKYLDWATTRGEKVCRCWLWRGNL